MAWRSAVPKQSRKLVFWLPDAASSVFIAISLHLKQFCVGRGFHLVIGGAYRTQRAFSFNFSVQSLQNLFNRHQKPGQEPLRLGYYTYPNFQHAKNKDMSVHEMWTQSCVKQVQVQNVSQGSSSCPKLVNIKWHNQFNS